MLHYPLLDKRLIVKQYYFRHNVQTTVFVRDFLVDSQKALADLSYFKIAPYGFLKSEKIQISISKPAEGYFGKN